MSKSKTFTRSRSVLCLLWKLLLLHNFCYGQTAASEKGTLLASHRTSACSPVFHIYWVLVLFFFEGKGVGSSIPSL